VRPLHQIKPNMPKATPISNLEHDFILAAMRIGQRVDGRTPFDVRTLNIVFGQKPGVVQIQLGRSRCEPELRWHFSLNSIFDCSFDQFS
jgi:hypothetical protein